MLHPCRFTFEHSVLVLQMLSIGRTRWFVGIFLEGREVLMLKPRGRKDPSEGVTGPQRCDIQNVSLICLSA